MEKKTPTLFEKVNNLFHPLTEKSVFCLAMMMAAVPLGYNYFKKRKEEEKDLNKKIILITGCESGIGKELAKKLCKMGYTVIATYKTQQSVRRNGTFCNTCYACQLDLTDQDTILNVKEQVKRILHEDEEYKLWGIVNCADFVIPGYFETISRSSMLKARQCLFLGPRFLIRCLLPMMYGRKQNTQNNNVPSCGCDGGRIIGITSLNARTPRATLSAYGPCKAAFCFFIQSLHYEVSPRFGISCSVVQTGTCNTNLMNRDTSEEYKDVCQLDGVQKFSNLVPNNNDDNNNDDNDNDNDDNLNECVDSIIDALSSSNPKRIYTVDQSNTPTSHFF